MDPKSINTKMAPIICSQCGAHIEYNETDNTVVCPYCGMKYNVNMNPVKNGPSKYAIIAAVSSTVAVVALVMSATLMVQLNKARASQEALEALVEAQAGNEPSEANKALENGSVEFVEASEPMGANEGSQQVLEENTSEAEVPETTAASETQQPVTESTGTEIDGPAGNGYVVKTSIMDIGDVIYTDKTGNGAPTFYFDVKNNTDSELGQIWIHYSSFDEDGNSIGDEQAYTQAPIMPGKKGRIYLQLYLTAEPDCVLYRAEDVSYYFGDTYGGTIELSGKDQLHCSFNLKAAREAAQSGADLSSIELTPTKDMMP